MTKSAEFDSEPYIFVCDMDKAVDFYVDMLGFTPVITDGKPSHFVQVERRGARLNLRLVETPVIDPDRREAEELLSATVTVSDIAALYADYSAAGVSFFQRLHTSSWGARTFILRDADGNLILFAG